MNEPSYSRVSPTDYPASPSLGCIMSQATFELYIDSAGEWRWRLRHQNTEIIADGGEGYSTEQAARNGIQSVKRNADAAPVEAHN